MFQLLGYVRYLCFLGVFFMPTIKMAAFGQAKSLSSSKSSAGVHTSLETNLGSKSVLVEKGQGLGAVLRSLGYEPNWQRRGWIERIHRANPKAVRNDGHVLIPNVVIEIPNEVLVELTPRIFTDTQIEAVHPQNRSWLVQKKLEFGFGSFLLKAEDLEYFDQLKLVVPSFYKLSLGSVFDIGNSLGFGGEIGMNYYNYELPRNLVVNLKSSNLIFGRVSILMPYLNSNILEFSYKLQSQPKVSFFDGYVIIREAAISKLQIENSSRFVNLKSYQIGAGLLGSYNFEDARSNYRAGHEYDFFLFVERAHFGVLSLSYLAGSQNTEFTSQDYRSTYLNIEYHFK